MEKQITVIAKQSLLDIAIQGSGTIETVFDVATDNNLNITDTLTPGKMLNIPDAEDSDADITTYYTNKQLRPISEYEAYEYIFLEGIGYWYIQNDFVVTAAD